MGSKLHWTFAAALILGAMASTGSASAATTNADGANAFAQPGADIAVTAGVGKTSTPQRVANRTRASKAQVELKEQEITRDLNRASVASLTPA